MRLITVSVLSIFAAIPAFANARLPVVNVAAGSVSARDAFGESSEFRVQSPEVALATKVVPVVSQKKPLVAAADVLMPKRPSVDLWAKMEKPLRLPESSEFAVIRSDFDLPEESIDEPAPAVARKAETNLDNQITKLVELQRKADESVRAVKVAVAKPEIKRVVVPAVEPVVRKAVDAPEFVSLDADMSKLSPTELKKAFKKTYLSENKHLSTYQIDDRFDVASDLSSQMEGFTSTRDLSEVGGVRPLEIKIGFRGDDSSLSRDNFNLLSEYASIVVSNPKRAIQISIPERATRDADARKLAARRLAIVEQVLRDTGVTDQRIMPVLAQRNDDSFVLRVISSDQFETLTQQKRDMFGDSVSKRTYKSMTW